MEETQNAIDLIQSQYMEAFKRLAENEKIKKKIEADEKVIKTEIQKAMEEYGIKNIKNEFITIGYVNGSTSTSIDLKTLEMEEANLYNDLIADYPKVTIKKPYVTFRVK